MALDKNETTLIIGAGVLAAVYFGVIRPITNKLGLTTSQKERELQKVAELASNNNGWDPNFYKQYQKNNDIILYKYATVADMARQINQAWGLLNDNVNAMYAVFRKLNSKVKLSQLCDVYNQLYKQDLLTRLKAPWYYLHDGLTESEFLEVSKIVNKLPNN
jgi:hypothetical protein